MINWQGFLHHKNQSLPTTTATPHHHDSEEEQTPSLISTYNHTEEGNMRFQHSSLTMTSLSNRRVKDTSDAELELSQKPHIQSPSQSRTTGERSNPVGSITAPVVSSIIGEHFNDEEDSSNQTVRRNGHHRPPSLTLGENAILQDIERQEEDEENNRKQASLGIANKKPSFILNDKSNNSTASMSIQQPPSSPKRKTSIDFMHPRTRRLTAETLDSTNNNKVFQIFPTTTVRKLLGFLDSMVPKLQHRCNAYMVILFILILFILGDSFEHVYSWLRLFFCMIFIDIVTAILDNMLFVYVIDKIFMNHFEIAYLLNGFNGPLGLFAEVLIAQSILKDRFEATNTLPYWHRLISASAIIIIFMCVKNWYARSHYIKLLEKRFTDRVLKLETWTILLSELSTMKPPKAQSGSPRSTTNHHVHHRDNHSSASVPPPVEISRRNTLNHLNEVLGDLNKKVHKKVVNVFADLVEATNKWNDENEEDLDVIKVIRESATTKVRTGKESAFSSSKDESLASTKPDANTVNDSDRSEAVHIDLMGHDDDLQLMHRVKLKAQLRKRKTFWQLAARISDNMGALKVFTYNGPVLLHRKFQARKFGRRLFAHLSRGGKLEISHEVLEKIFTWHHLHLDNDEDDGCNEELKARKQKYSEIKMLSGAAVDKDDATILYENAIALLDPYDLGYVTEEQCIAAMIQVYKEQRFVASSLNDYGELHQSLRTVIDFAFWLLMAIIVQAFLELNVFNYLIPFVTILLSISFALSPLLGNLFLAITYVFFMVPYDVGNKICIDPNGSKIVGYVRSVSLLYTTINTMKNEVMKIPNHLLFSEKVCNYAESGGMTFLIDIDFNMVEEDRCRQDKVDEFFDQLKKYVLVDCKAEWESFSVYVMNLNASDDTVTHQIWVTHRDNYQDVTKPYNARNDLMKEMKRMISAMGLTFAKIQQPVKVAYNNNNSNHEKSASSTESLHSSGPVSEKSSSRKSALSVNEF